MDDANVRKDTLKAVGLLLTGTVLFCLTFLAGLGKNVVVWRSFVSEGGEAYWDEYSLLEVLSLAALILLGLGIMGVINLARQRRMARWEQERRVAQLERRLARLETPPDKQDNSPTAYP